MVVIICSARLDIEIFKYKRLKSKKSKNSTNKCKQGQNEKI